jgi:hypothetical protein
MQTVFAFTGPRQLVPPLMLVALLCIATPAVAMDLDAFLHGAEVAAQAAVPVRAEGQFEVVSPEATRRDEIALVMRPPADMFIELRREGFKALLLADGAFYVKNGASKAQPFPLDATLGDSNFTREDLEPFRASRYKEALISDDSATSLMLMLSPVGSQYSLEETTFDRQKKVPLKIQYYQGTVSNLIKLQRDSDYVLVGDKWRPTTISMETFTLRTHTTLKLHWALATDLRADLFNPASLAQPSLTLWPAAPAKP